MARADPKPTRRPLATALKASIYVALVAVLALFLLGERLSVPMALLILTAVGGAVIVLGGSGASGDARGITIIINN